MTREQVGKENRKFQNSSEMSLLDLWKYYDYTSRVAGGIRLITWICSLKWLFFFFKYSGFQYLNFQLKGLHPVTIGHEKLSYTTKSTFFTLLKERSSLAMTKRFNGTLIPLFTAILFYMPVQVFYAVIGWTGPRTDLTKIFVERNREDKWG